MAQLVRFYRKETGSHRDIEYVVIDTEDLTRTTLIGEYGEDGYELGDVLEIEGDVTSFPTDRSLSP